MSKRHREDLKKRIRVKEAKIRQSRNVVDISDEIIHRTMGKYNYDNYRIEVWGDITLKSDIDEWIIENDGEVIRLLHRTKGIISLKGNMRSSYHIQDVFYDLDYCIRSIRWHDDYKKGIKKG